jgi:hypothetical protein
VEVSDRSARYRLSENDFVAAALAFHRAAMASRKRWLIIFAILTAVLIVQLWREDSLGDVPLLIICLLLIAGLTSLALWLVEHWLLPARMRRYLPPDKAIRRRNRVQLGRANDQFLLVSGRKPYAAWRLARLDSHARRAAAL